MKGVLLYQMSDSITISIIVPIYKVEAYLDRCVKSIQEQTYSNLEIILVDDGSPDSCPKMCERYAKEDSRIRVIHKPNGGLSDARNAGIEVASGDYIMFVDSDDYIEPDACERLVSFMKDRPDIVIGDGKSNDKNRKTTHCGFYSVCSGKEYLKRAVKINAMPVMVCLYVFNRDFLNNSYFRFKKGIAHEDEEFTPRVFLQADSVIETGVCFYNYIVRDDSITTRSDLRKNAIDLYNTCLELAKRYAQLEDNELKRILLDSLVMKYLSLAQTGRLYRYGRDYIHKSFVMRNSFFTKTKFKALLYCLSPFLYWHINNITKKIK